MMTTVPGDLSSSPTIPPHSQSLLSLEPDANEVNFIIRFVPSGQTFVTGISSHYKFDYKGNIETKGIITEHEINDILDDINDAISSFWPCGPAYFCGLMCCPLTLGASLLCPNYCISQAEEKLVEHLRSISMRAKFYDRRITFSLHKSMCDSRIEMTIPQKLYQGR